MARRSRWLSALWILGRLSVVRGCWTRGWALREVGTPDEAGGVARREVERQIRAKAGRVSRLQPSAASKNVLAVSPRRSGRAWSPSAPAASPLGPRWPFGLPAACGAPPRKCLIQWHY